MGLVNTSKTQNRFDIQGQIGLPILRGAHSSSKMARDALGLSDVLPNSFISAV